MKTTRNTSELEARVPVADVEWILFDTETTGLAAPVFVVELAAQRMRGWEPDGEPFRKLLNQNQDICISPSL